ncbi:MAG TPA: hypothetical protein VN701_00970 [Candidatus Paceibacterota bacterium]|nr:hypothetical protein [Candidatus Paceibacterota bacterium]
MRYVSASLLALLFLPFFAHAAGFAKQSLFLSKSPVTDGDSVLVYSVLQNDDAAKFSGDVTFSAQAAGGDKEKIGTVAVSIALQGAETVSVSWKPAAGTYAVTAELAQTDGTVVESESASFTINEKPKPASTESGSTSSVGEQVQSSADVQAMIAKWVPGISGASQPVFSTIDALRGKAASLLDQGIGWSKAQVGAKQPGEVLGAATQNVSPSGITGTASYLAGLIMLYVFSVLKWLVSNAGVFYPVLAFAFLYALWRIFARMRRPSY